MRFCKEREEKDGVGQGHDVSSCQLETVRGFLNRVPVVEVTIAGNKTLALIDTGCSQSMVVRRFTDKVSGETSVLAFDGREVRCLGYSRLSVEVGGETVVQDVRVVESLVGGVGYVLGMDIITKLGGVTVDGNIVKFGKSGVCAMTVCQERKPDIEDIDFEAYFDGTGWTVRYFWNELGEPKLKKMIGQYDKQMGDEQRRSYEAEVERWIDEGILVPWSGEVEGLLPLMAVEQPTKHKVRPVLDYRELNEYVSCHTGDEVTDICNEKMREWRQTEGEAEIVDLKSAYLQIKVTEDLWKHQLVKYKGKLFCLTRLGFGLTSAPRIMSKILKTVLAKDVEIGNATSSFIDDIHVDQSKVTSDAVVKHLKNNGLVAKAPEALDGGAALGLKLRRADDGTLMYNRANVIPDVGEKLTKKELYSICGKLVGHYPVAGWLRLACSYIKRHVKCDKWNDHVDEETMRKIREIVDEVKRNDPVVGKWHVPKSDSGSVWVDASDLALGVKLEVGDTVAEDGTWMRKIDDYNHINVAELEAVLKGINLAVHWGLSRIVVKTDSETVEGWLKTTLNSERRVTTKGAAEMLITRRLGVLKSLVDEYQLQIEVQHV